MPKDEDKSGGELPALPPTVTYHYIKGQDYRPVHVDGIVGGPTTRGLIHMAVFTEHAAIPQKTVQKVAPDGKVGEELPEHRVARDGIVRDVSVALVMDCEIAEQIVAWLQGHVATIKKVREMLAAKAKSAADVAPAEATAENEAEKPTDV